MPPFAALCKCCLPKPPGSSGSATKRTAASSSPSKSSAISATAGKNVNGAHKTKSPLRAANELGDERTAPGSTLIAAGITDSPHRSGPGRVSGPIGASPAAPGGSKRPVRTSSASPASNSTRATQTAALRSRDLTRSTQRRRSLLSTTTAEQARAAVVHDVIQSYLPIAENRLSSEEYVQILNCNGLIK